MKNRKLRSALRAASRGCPVLPLCWVEEDGDCSCGDPECTTVGKHPLTPHGVKDATTDEATIRQRWHDYPDANVGVATGKPSGLVVVDVDLSHGGIESIRQFESENGPLPKGPAVRTGGGGLHLYFKHFGNNIKNKVGLLQGVDVRGDGGYVVYPASIHRSGKKYLWLYNRSPKKIATPVFRLSAEPCRKGTNIFDS